MSETCLDSSIDNSEVSIRGYDICNRLDRQVSTSGGGVLCYIKSHLVYKEIDVLKDDDIEAVWVEICLPNTKPMLVGTVYRPPPPPPP